MYQTIEDYIKKHCPQLFQLFCETVNSDEYITSGLVKIVDKLGLEQEKAMRKEGINTVGFYEFNDYYNQFLGFFFGFQLACRIREEVK